MHVCVCVCGEYVRPYVFNSFDQKWCEFYALTCFDFSFDSFQFNL